METEKASQKPSRLILQRELARRCAKNPAYSLRAFATLIGLSPSHLSRVLNGQRMLSVDIAARIATSLQMTEQQKSHFLDLVQFDATTDEKVRLKILERLKKSRGKSRESIVGLDRFQVISEWYHFAILALTKLKDFRPDFAWVSQKLSISLAEAKDAVQRLQDVGLLSLVQGRWELTNAEGFSTPSDLQSLAIQKNHQQMIEKAKERLTEIPVDLREYHGLTVSFRTARMKEAKKMIRDFINRFDQEFAEDNGDELFQLNLQLFPLTIKKK